MTLRLTAAQDLAETEIDPLHDSARAWWISLSSIRPYQAQLFQILSPPERERRAGFKSLLARDRYTITHAILRILLSHYSRQAPASISIIPTSTGKLFAFGQHMPEFSVSHSAGVALLAFARCPLGVDVENIHEIPEMLAIAKQFFSDREFRYLIALPPERRQQAFFAGWTGREAYLKATGEGLSGFSKDSKVPLDPSSFHSVFSDGTHRQWQLSRFERENYSVAFVTSSCLSSLTLQEFAPELLAQISVLFD